MLEARAFAVANNATRVSGLAISMASVGATTLSVQSPVPLMQLSHGQLSSDASWQPTTVTNACAAIALPKGAREVLHAAIEVLRASSAVACGVIEQRECSHLCSAIRGSSRSLRILSRNICNFPTVAHAAENIHRL